MSGPRWAASSSRPLTWWSAAPINTGQQFEVGPPVTTPPIFNFGGSSDVPVSEPVGLTVEEPEQSTAPEPAAKSGRGWQAEASRGGPGGWKVDTSGYAEACCDTAGRGIRTIRVTRTDAMAVTNRSAGARAGCGRAGGRTAADHSRAWFRRPNPGIHAAPGDDQEDFVTTGRAARSEGASGTARDSLGYLLAEPPWWSSGYGSWWPSGAPPIRLPTTPSAACTSPTTPSTELLGSAAAEGVAIDHEQLAQLDAEAERGRTIRNRHSAPHGWPARPD